MLDSNLLTFFLADATDGTKHHSAFYQTRADSEPEPAYTLRHADPASPASKNCYAAALFDAFAADILYGEVLVQPKWNQPSLSQEDRRSGGVPPPPEPVLPLDFTIQLYNPDQQIHFTHHIPQLLGATKWEFSMPQDTFRAPSSSMLDKAQDDPGATVTTPRINFTWRKESKFTKDMVCYVTGKSTDVQSKRKHKEADIAVAIFKGLKEITIYEPNLYRVEMEDPKGLEVTLLLSAAVIKDVYFGNLRQAFNISDGPRRVSDGRPEPLVSPPPANGGGSGASVAYLHGRSDSQSPSGVSSAQRPANAAINRTNTKPQSPITDPRTQWEIDAETARLKAQFESEERERRRIEEIRRRDRERADAEETKRLKKMVEQEDKEARARQKEVDKETERLKRLHGPQAPQQQWGQGFPAANAGPAPLVPQPGPPVPQHPFASRPPVDYYGYPPQPVVNQAPYQQPGAYQYPQGGNAPSSSLNPGRPPPKRKSFLNLNLR